MISWAKPYQGQLVRVVDTCSLAGQQINHVRAKGAAYFLYQGDVGLTIDRVFTPDLSRSSNSRREPGVRRKLTVIISGASVVMIQRRVAGCLPGLNAI